MPCLSAFGRYGAVLVLWLAPYAPTARAISYARE